MAIQDYENSIINALSISDPSMDTSLGTPIRKIITAVANEINSYETDKSITKSLYALESVSGQELDWLVAQFGFTRQDSRAAIGTVTVSRDNGDTLFPIPYGSQFYKQSTPSSPGVMFQTTAYQELAEGVLSAEIAVKATTAGSVGNVQADTITYTTSYTGYLNVTNEHPTTGGRDAETDDELRLRFLNTVFRNVSGTKDQYLGLALAHTKNNRANVIGQSSKYTEIVKVKRKDNGQLYIRTTYSDEYNRENGEGFAGTAIDTLRRFWATKTDEGDYLDRGRYTVKHIASTGQYECDFKTVISEDLIGPAEYGETFKLSHNALSDSGYSVKISSTGAKLVEGNDYTIDLEEGSITLADYSENLILGETLVVTYKHYPVAENDFVTIEFDYLNTINRNKLKSVEVYIDGASLQQVSDIQYLELDNEITAEMAKRWVREDGSIPYPEEPKEVTNEEGGVVDYDYWNHVVVPLSYQPLLQSTGEINVGTSTILEEGVHYRVLHDVTPTEGSIYGCDAIELIGEIFYDNQLEEECFRFTNDKDVILTNDTPMNIPYYYNDVVESVQKLITAQSVVTMDTLVHQAHRRYFGIYLTVMYSTFPRNTVTGLVEENIRAWADGLPFGSVIQFSDIETVVANTLGIDNVRVSVEGRDSDTNFGIVEFELDGRTEKARYTNDFSLRQNEIFEVQFVDIYAKAQQDW